MPRIPRADAQLPMQIASMPQLAGDGWTAPGRAMQQLGHGIQRLGAALGEFAERQEDEHLHEARIEALKLKNQWDLDEIESRATYAGDGKDYGAQRAAAWSQRAAEFRERYASAGPKVRRFVDTFTTSATGEVSESAARFGRTRWEDTLFSRTQEAALGEIAKLATPEAADRYAANPEQLQADLESAMTAVDGMLNSLPLDPSRKRVIANAVAGQLKAMIGKAPTEAAIDAIREKIGKLGADARTSGADPQTPGPQSSLAAPVRDFTTQPGRGFGKLENPKYIVVHDVSGNDPARKRLPAGGNIPNYHITFDRNGIYLEVPFDRQAPHAMAYNKESIGIAHIGYEGDTLEPEAIRNGAKAVLMVQERFGIPAERIITHPEGGARATGRGGKDPREGSWRKDVLDYIAAHRTELLAELKGAPQTATQPARRISEGGVAAIKKEEGWRPQAYRDGGQTSIGWGTRGRPGERIDEAEGNRRLMAELGEAEAAIAKHVTAPLTQAQHDALVSYVFNAGPNGRARAVFKAINAGDLAKAAEIMRADDKAGVVKARRAREVAMFLGEGAPQAKPDLASRSLVRIAGIKQDTASDATPRAENTIPGRQAAEAPQTMPGYVRTELLRDIMPLVPALEAKLKAETVKQIESANERAMEGRLPSETERATIDRRVKRINDPALTAAWEDAQRRGQWTSALRALPPDVLESQVRQAQAHLAVNGGSEDEFKRVDALDKLHRRMTAELQKNPYKWAVEVGAIAPPVEITRDTFGPDALARRAQDRMAVQSRFGVKVPFFQPDEAKTIGEIMDRGGQPMIAAAGMIVEAFGPESVEAFGQIAKDKPDAAHLGWLVARKAPPGVVTDLAMAVEARKGKGDKVEGVVTSDAIRTRYYEQFRGALTGVEDEVRERVLSAAATLYAYRVQRLDTKPDPRNPDKKILDRALRDVLGENKVGDVTYGGVATGGNSSYQYRYPVHLPPHVRQDGFFELLDTLRNSDFAWTPVTTPAPSADAPARPPEDTRERPAGYGVRRQKPPAPLAAHPSVAEDTEGAQAAVRAAEALPTMTGQTPDPGFLSGTSLGAPVDHKGRPMSWAAIVARGTFIAVGEGRYQIAMGDPRGEEPAWVNSVTGRPFVFDLAAVEPIVRARRPDLFRPY